MKPFKIFCPFCGDEIYSDVVDCIKDVKGEWQCTKHGHTFLVQYIDTIR